MKTTQMVYINHMNKRTNAQSTNDRNLHFGAAESIHGVAQTNKDCQQVHNLHQGVNYSQLASTQPTRKLEVLGARGDLPCTFFRHLLIRSAAARCFSIYALIHFHKQVR